MGRRDFIKTARALIDVSASPALSIAYVKAVHGTAPTSDFY